MRTARFWWIALGYFCVLYAWYAVQVHQTKYLIEIGVSPMEAAWALGIVSLAGVPGRSSSAMCRTASAANGPGRSAALGFVICFAALIALQRGADPGAALHHGAGAGLSRLFGDLGARADRRRDLRGAAFRLDLRHADAVRRSSAARPARGSPALLHDHTGNYDAAFWIALALSIVSAIAIFIAAPRKVRLVAGRVGQ